MSRIDELKKQNPHFNMSFFDLFRIMDTTKSGKYTPLLTMMTNGFIEQRMMGESYNSDERLSEIGIEYKDLSFQQRFVTYYMAEYVIGNDWNILRDFMDYMERGLIENKDVLTYKSMEQVKNAVSAASLRLFSKELESQVHKEFEDDTWIAVRPLSFEASSKYGAGTKWCTTYKREKEYFVKYFKNGALIYFINKITGYKFALFSEVYPSGNNEISFWNAEDQRVDFLQVDVDSYLLPVIKKLVNSKIKNRDLLTDKEFNKVLIECDMLDEEKGHIIRRLYPVPPPDEVRENVDVVTNDTYPDEDIPTISENYTTGHAENDVRRLVEDELRAIRVEEPTDERGRVFRDTLEREFRNHQIQNLEREITENLLRQVEEVTNGGG